MAGNCFVRVGFLVELSVRESRIETDDVGLPEAMEIESFKETDSDGADDFVGGGVTVRLLESETVLERVSVAERRGPEAEADGSQLLENVRLVELDRVSMPDGEAESVGVGRSSAVSVASSDSVEVILWVPVTTETVLVSVGASLLSVSESEGVPE